MEETGSFVNYYRKLSDIIRADMGTPELREILDKKAQVLAHRFDPDSFDTLQQIRAALQVFRDEAARQEYDRQLAESGQKRQEEDPLRKQREQLQELKQRAKSYLDDGECDLARLAIEKALELDAARDDSGAYLLAARVFRANKAYDPALEYINKVIFAEPENMDPLLFKAAVFAEKAAQLKAGPDFSASPQLRQEAQKCRAERRRQLKKAVELAKGRGDGTEARARGLLAHALYFDADPAAREKDQADGVAEAQEAERCGTSEEARAVLESHAEIQQAEEWFRLAEKHFKNGEYDQAKTQIDKVLAASPSPAVSVYRLASKIYLMLDELDAALQYAESVIQQKSRNPVLFGRDIVQKTNILDKKILSLEKSSGLRSSPQQQEAYRKFRAMGQETAREGYRIAAGTGNLKLRAWATVMLARMLYFCCDALDENNARQERSEGVKYAREVLSFDSGSVSPHRIARKILDDHAAKENAQREKQLAEQKAQREKQLAEQKAQREKQKAEWDAQLKRMQGLCEDGQFDVAKVALEKVLAQSANRRDGAPDEALYTLATKIYTACGEFDAAFQSINEALLREAPESRFSIECTILKAQIYGEKAWSLAKSSYFRSSPEQQREYQELRDKEEALFDQTYETLEAAQRQLGKEAAAPLWASFWGSWALARYCRPHRSDENQAARDRSYAIQCVDRAEVKTALAGAAPSECFCDYKKVREILSDHRKRSDCLNRAEIACVKDEYASAKEAIDEALQVDVWDRGLYKTAARIYFFGDFDLDLALRYINKAITIDLYYLQNPDAIGFYGAWDTADTDPISDQVFKGRILGQKALKLASRSTFRSSSELQKEYRALRVQELAVFNTARGRAEDAYRQSPNRISCKLALAEALGFLADALYFGADRLDAQKAQQERREGVSLAREAQACDGGLTGSAGKILKDFNAEQTATRQRQTEWTQRAREHYNNRQYDAAKTAVEAALANDIDHSDASMYQLASRIYRAKGDHAAALRYIDKALALHPKNIYYLVTKGITHGEIARELSQRSNFSSSSDLQKRYRTARDEELKLFRKAVGLAQNTKDRVYALEYLAWALYFRADRADPSRYTGDSREGIEMAQSILQQSESADARAILEDREKRAQQAAERFRTYAEDAR